MASTLIPYANIHLCQITEPVHRARSYSDPRPACKHHTRQAAMSEQKRTRKRDNPNPSGSHINISPSTERPSKRPSQRQLAAEAGFDFRLAIDFGTKYTTVACTKGEGSKTPIFTIQEFPGDRMPGRVGTQVPTEIAYLQQKEQQSTKHIYGYEILSQHEVPDEEYEEAGHVTNIKLLLDKSPHLKHLRKDLMLVLRKLKTAQVIQKHENVIYDLLVCYLQHTKEILQRDYGLNSSSKGKLLAARRHLKFTSLIISS